MAEVQAPRPSHRQGTKAGPHPFGRSDRGVTLAEFAPDFSDARVSSSGRSIQSEIAREFGKDKLVKAVDQVDRKRSPLIRPPRSGVKTELQAVVAEVDVRERSWCSEECLGRRSVEPVGAPTVEDQP